MQNIEEEFNSYYLDNLNKDELLPSFITEYFNIEACLSSSETKCVYVISDIIFSRKYILKQVSRQHFSQSEVEREMLSAFDHPSIPKVYKWYSDDNYTYMLREYFDGMTLGAYVHGNGPVRDDEAVDLAIQVCDLLAYLHSQNPPVIHRDIKPQNLILRTDGKIGLIDFDTSRQYNLQAGNDTVYMGTLQTAAPEQFGYKQTDHQTDIYSLGILIIYLKTGSYDRADTCHMTPRLRKVAEKCTEFSPKDRYKNVDEVKRHLFGKRSTLFRGKVMAGLCALFVGSIILSGTLTAVHMAKQARIPNYGETGNIPGKDTTAEKAESISFKNPGIERAVRSILGKTAGESLSKLELGQITTLEIMGDIQIPVIYDELQHNFYENRLSYKGEDLKRGPVDSLEDLALLPFLTDLTLIYQQISDLSGIEKLNLLKLNLSYNNISDLTPLKDMESLAFLRVNCNPIKDLSPLRGLTKLSTLEMSSTYVKDLTPISSCQSLMILGIFGLKDLDLSPIKELKNLKEVYQ